MHSRYSRFAAWRGWIAAAALGLGCGGLQAAEGAEDGARRLTKDEILMSVEAAQARMQDLSIAFTNNMVQGQENQVKGNHIRAVFKGEKLYLENEWCKDPASDGPRFHSATAYNGNKTTAFWQDHGRALVYSGRDMNTGPSMSVISEFMMTRPATELPPSGIVPNNLVTLLSSPNSRLREGLEELDGWRCYVVDVMGRGGAVTETVWLDPGRGMLPVRHLLFSPQAPGMPFVEYTIDDAVEAAPGIWVMTRGTHRGRMLGPVPRPDMWLQVDVLEVDRKEDGTLDLAVNSGVQDEFFDLWKRLPAGTLLLDRDADIAVTVGSLTSPADAGLLRELGDPSAIAEQPATAVPAAEINASSDAPPVAQATQPPAVARGRRTAVTVIVLCVCAAVGAAIALRRARARG